jgi:hypothetical protein
MISQTFKTSSNIDCTILQVLPGTDKFILEMQYGKSYWREVFTADQVNDMRKITRIQPKLKDKINYKDQIYTLEEQFVALSVRWVRAEDPKGHNKYFTEQEWLKLKK